MFVSLTTTKAETAVNQVTLKAPTTTEADDILKSCLIVVVFFFFFLLFFQKKSLAFHVNRLPLAGRRFTMKCKAFFSLRKKKKKK